MKRLEADWTTAGSTQPGPGDQVDGYSLVRQLGAGGMATVFEATAPDGRSVALKLLNPTRLLPEDVKRFTREFDAVASMSHPNVISVFEAGVFQGLPWIAMELVDGTDLDAEIARWRTKEPTDRFERIERIFREVCDGLAYVHERGLVHRDLKPSNILLTADGIPKLSDFGVVKGDTASTQLTLAGRLVGTVAFMAPELITDDNVDARADLYALGSVLYLMCTYRRPIEANTVAGYLARHLTEVPRPITDLEPRAPRKLEAIAQRLLQKDRSLRYPTAAAVKQALDRTPENATRPLRGRDDLLHEWTRWILQLQAGASATLAVHGPRGAGRSHVVDAMRDHARAHGARCCVARARDGDVLGQLAAALGDPELSLEQHLANAPDTPTALLIDDADHAAPEEVERIAALLRSWVTVEARPLLLAYTAADAHGALAELQRGESTGVPALTQELEPLDARSSVALVRDRGVIGTVAPVLGRRLSALYRGLPGPMVDQLGALVDDGWLIEQDDQLVAHRKLDAFRGADLPVPELVRKQVMSAVSHLSEQGQAVAEILAVLGRPATAGTIERSLGDPGPDARARTTAPIDADLIALLDELVRKGVLSRTVDDNIERLGLQDPSAPRVLFDSMGEAHRERIHGAIANALQRNALRRRHANLLEIATHLEAAGEIPRALPMYVRAARRAAREGRSSEVIDICRTAEAIGDHPSLEQCEPSEIAEHRRWLALLRGQAHLARRSWEPAEQVLADAVGLAQAAGDELVLEQAWAARGRALYRLGRLDEARTALDAAAQASGGDPLDGPSERMRADLALQHGDLDEADTRWSTALQRSLVLGDRDDEARARRGIAHVRMARGQLEEAHQQLTRAHDLLSPDGDYRVRAAVLSRSAELDAVTGRFGSALHRAEQLVELARRHGLGDRMPTALGLLATVHAALGDRAKAAATATEGLTFARAQGPGAWAARLLVGRVYLDLGEPEEARTALPDPGQIPSLPLLAARAQALALSARATGRVEDARQALASLGTSEVPICAALARLDAARALLPEDPGSAAECALHGLKLSDAAGIQLQLRLVLLAAQPSDASHRQGLRDLVRRILPHLPSPAAEAFKGQAPIRQALG